MDFDFAMKLCLFGLVGLGIVVLVIGVVIGLLL